MRVCMHQQSVREPDVACARFRGNDETGGVGEGFEQGQNMRTCEHVDAIRVIVKEIGTKSNKRDTFDSVHKVFERNDGNKSARDVLGKRRNEDKQMCGESRYGDCFGRDGFDRPFYAKHHDFERREDTFKSAGGHIGGMGGDEMAKCRRVKRVVVVERRCDAEKRNPHADPACTEHCNRVDDDRAECTTHSRGRELVDCVRSRCDDSKDAAITLGCFLQMKNETNTVREVWGEMSQAVHHGGAAKQTPAHVGTASSKTICALHDYLSNTDRINVFCNQDCALSAANTVISFASKMKYTNFCNLLYNQKEFHVLHLASGLCEFGFLVGEIEALCLGVISINEAGLQCMLQIHASVHVLLKFGILQRFRLYMHRNAKSRLQLTLLASQSDLHLAQRAFVAKLQALGAVEHTCLLRDTIVSVLQNPKQCVRQTWCCLGAIASILAGCVSVQQRAQLLNLQICHIKMPSVEQCTKSVFVVFRISHLLCNASGDADRIDGMFACLTNDLGKSSDIEMSLCTDFRARLADFIQRMLEISKCCKPFATVSASPNYDRGFPVFRHKYKLASVATSNPEAFMRSVLTPIMTLQIRQWMLQEKNLKFAKFDIETEQRLKVNNIDLPCSLLDATEFLSASGFGPTTKMENLHTDIKPKHAVIFKMNNLNKVTSNRKHILNITSSSFWH